MHANDSDRRIIALIYEQCNWPCEQKATFSAPLCLAGQKPIASQDGMGLGTGAIVEVNVAKHNTDDQREQRQA